MNKKAHNLHEICKVCFAVLSALNSFENSNFWIRKIRIFEFLKIRILEFRKILNFDIPKIQYFSDLSNSAFYT